MFNKQYNNNKQHSNENILKLGAKKLIKNKYIGYDIKQKCIKTI